MSNVMNRIKEEAIPAVYAGVLAGVGASLMGVNGNTSLFGVQFPLTVMVAGTTASGYLAGELASDYILPTIAPSSSSGLRKVEQQVVPIATGALVTYGLLKMRFPTAEFLPLLALSGASGYGAQMASTYMLGEKPTY